MITLGLAHDVVISSAAVVRDGQVVAAIAEERLNRQKHYKGFPALALKECLRTVGATINDVAAVAVGWNPVRHLDFPNHRFSSIARYRPEYLYAVPNMLLGSSELSSGAWIDQIFDGMAPRVRYYDHHLTHAANAFYLSSFESAAVFTADGRGERETAMWGKATRSEGIDQRGNLLFPHSLGLFYGAVTQFLGYKADGDEWKVMAMASYGTPDNPFYPLMKELVEVDARTGKLYIDQRYFSYAVPESYSGRFFTPEFIEKFGPARHASDAMDQRHCDIAWALQRVFEEAMWDLLSFVHGAVGEDQLVAGGGCMMNSVCNGKITQRTPFKEVFISSCPDDSGISVGAALLAYNALAESPQSGIHSHNYWGPSYEETILETLLKYKIDFVRLNDPSNTAAVLLAEGMIIGWYQGRMEFGQRALGNRSILADPRRIESKELVNAAVKYRESFRPFAPAILADRVTDFFVAPAGKVQFMERVYMFHEDVKHLVPAVVHADGTGRVQTVEREENPRFYDVIAAFDRITGIPLVLNTSFNLNGEPIVCTPTDAIRTFYSCGLDVLILGDYMLSKRTSGTPLIP